MKEILSIFKRDISQILKSKMAVLIVVGLIFVPGIYAWLNIDSNWDPYDNTGNLEIAVVNNDQGTEILNADVNIGDNLVENLKNNNSMKWVFTDEETAKTGVESGDYYGAIILPADFSSRLTTLFDNTEIKRPEFDFLINQKQNPVAPIIVDKAIDTVKTTLDQAFVNKVIYGAVDEAESLNLDENGVATTSAVISRLNETKSDLDKVKTTLNTVANATSATASAFSAVKDLLPSVKNLSDTTASNILNLQTNVNSLGNIYEELDRNVSSNLQASEKLATSISDSINSLSPSNPNYQQQIANLETALDSLSTILDEQIRIVNSLNTIANSATLSQLSGQLSQAKQTTEQVKQSVHGLSDGTSIPSQTQATANKLKNDLSQLSSNYTNTVSPIIKNSFNNFNNSLKSFVNTFASLGSSFSKSELALSNTIDALNSTSGLAVNINDILTDLQKDIDQIIKVLTGATESDIYLKLVNLLQNSPEEVANFISSPIAVNKIDYYPIEHYGSKMSPFYTILATWVGCTILASVLKTNLPNTRGKRTKPYQAFFGRFMLFAFIAVAQGLVIGIGDIFLGVQILNHPLFLLTIMLSSLVYMLIIYSLTISFGKIGEAITIIVMVLQVAGSGGTFPIELMPDFFQKLQPFMPFYPSMGALRETIGGFYQNTYIMFILLLLCHTILPLILGLVIRNPIIRLKQKLSKDVEETKIIV